MSAKKPFLSDKEYKRIYARLAEARKKLNEQFMKAMEADASIAEHGGIFLRYFNRFRSDAERIVAIIDIFYLGMNIRKLGDDAEAVEKFQKELLEKMLEEIKKKGDLPS